MTTNPLAPDPETDIDGPDVLPPLEPDTGDRERAWKGFPIPEEEQEDIGGRVPLEEEDENVEPGPALIASV